jgi:hypothetical protein
MKRMERIRLAAIPLRRCIPQNSLLKAKRPAARAFFTLANPGQVSVSLACDKNG